MNVSRNGSDKCEFLDNDIEHNRIYVLGNSFD